MIKTTTESIKERFRMQTRQTGDSCNADTAFYDIYLLTKRG
jgi:hypothetical protein